jgi:hypothetical protein
MHIVLCVPGYVYLWRNGWAAGWLNVGRLDGVVSCVFVLAAHTQLFMPGLRYQAGAATIRLEVAWLLGRRLGWWVADAFKGGARFDLLCCPRFGVRRTVRILQDTKFQKLVGAGSPQSQSHLA